MRSEDSVLQSDEVVTQGPLTLKVSVIEAQPSKDVYRTASYLGTVKPNRSTYLTFARGGRVLEVLAEVGDQVEADQNLASLDQQELPDRKKELELSLDPLRGRLNNLNPNSRSTAARNQISQLNEQIKSLELEKRDLDRELEKGIIAAPFRGIVAERSIDVGDEIPAGRPAFKILDDSSPIIEVQVTSELAEQVSVGKTVWLRNGGELVEARVAQKSPELSRASITQLLRLELKEDNPNRTWVYGDAIETRFWIPTDQDGFWLPYSALHREHNGLWAALTVERKGDQQFVARKNIEIVQMLDDYALVKGALERGDLVIIEGSNRIVPDQLVMPVVLPATFSQSGPPESVE